MLFYVEVPSIGNEAQFWDFVIDEYDIIAYPENPEYYSKIYLLEPFGIIN